MKEWKEMKKSERCLFSAKNVLLFHHYLSEDAGWKKAQAVCVQSKKLEFGFGDDSEQNQSVLWVLHRAI